MIRFTYLFILLISTLFIGSGQPAWGQAVTPGESYFFIQHWILGRILDADPADVPPPAPAEVGRAASATLLATLGDPATDTVNWREPIATPLPAAGNYTFDMNDVANNWNLEGQPTTVSIATRGRGVGRVYGAGPATIALNNRAFQEFPDSRLVAGGGVSGIAVALRLFLQGYFDNDTGTMSTRPTVVLEARRRVGGAAEDPGTDASTAMARVGDPVTVTLGTDGRGTALWLNPPDPGLVFVVLRQQASPTSPVNSNHLALITRRTMRAAATGTFELNLSEGAGREDAFSPRDTAVTPMNRSASGILLMRAGDMDGNGFINSADYSLWRGVWMARDGRGPAVPTELATVDMNGDGFANSADYSVWRDNWMNYRNQTDLPHSYLPEFLAPPAPVVGGP